MTTLLMLLSVICCSMFIITPPPSWLEGNWRLLDEDNLQIGECEISGEDITITRTEWEYEEINLMSMAYQNGGWAETDSDRYHTLPRFQRNLIPCIPEPWIIRGGSGEQHQQYQLSHHAEITKKDRPCLIPCKDLYFYISCILPRSE